MGGGGVAGNGLGLLNGQTTKRDSITTVEEAVGSFFQIMDLGYSTMSPSVPGSCPESF
jgi:hypothetical protein